MDLVWLSAVLFVRKSELNKVRNWLKRTFCGTTKEYFNRKQVEEE